MSSTLKGESEMKECYISVDVETTGPDPEHYPMIELGAVAAGDLKQEFFTKLFFPLFGSSIDHAALRAIGLTEKTLRERYQANDAERASKAMVRFSDWIKFVAGKDNPVFVANNAAFDWMYICRYFRVHRIVNPFGHSALDMKALFMGMTGCTWKDATLKNMAKHVGLKFTKLPHHALEDAKIQGEIFRLLLEKRKQK